MTADSNVLEIEIRVRYCECDPMGYLHHAKYFEYLEVARTELLRNSTISYRQLEERGVFFVVAKFDIRYKGPVRYDDVVTIRTRIDRITRTRIDHHYDVINNGMVVTEANSTLACVNGEGRPIIMPEDLWSE